MLSADWIVKRIADGTMYYPPEGRGFGAIGIRERIRPCRPFNQLFTEQLRRFEHAITDLQIEPTEQIVTSEGEYAAIRRYDARARDDRSAVQCVYAVVFGDDFFDQIDAYCTEEAAFPRFRMLVREVVFGHRLGLGTDRARPFYYDPPKGWKGVRRNLLVEWYPPDFPHHRAKIAVASVISQRSHTGLMDSQLLAFGRMYGFTARDQSEPAHVTTLHGLSGVQVTVHGTFGVVPGFDGKPDPFPSEVVTTALRDDRYTYLLRLETTSDHRDDHALFADVVRSARPVPTEASRESDLFVAWAKEP